MKKLYLVLTAVIMTFIMIPLAKADNNVRVYAFTKNGCPACESAFETFDKWLSEDPDLFELVNLEVWSGSDSDGSWILGSQDLYDLVVESLKHFDEDYEKLYTPTIVVGDYLQVGANDLDSLKKRIEEMKTSDDYQDVVAELAKEKDINLNEYVQKVEENKSDALIIVGIFVVLVGGFAALIIISKK